MERRQSGFTEVYTSMDANSIHLAQALLESEGITSTIKGEVINQIMTGYMGTTWITLSVPYLEKEKAIQILRDAKYQVEEEPQSLSREDQEEALKRWEREKRKRIYLIILAIIAVLVILAFYTQMVQNR